MPHQAALLPELAPPPPVADVCPRIALWGLLAEDARYYASADGRSHLQVVIAQHLAAVPDACPLVATYHYPDHGAPHATAQAAAAMAARLRRGSEVMVAGEGPYPTHHLGRPAMALAGVRSIRPIDDHLPPAHHAPAGDA